MMGRGGCLFLLWALPTPQTFIVVGWIGGCLNLLATANCANCHVKFSSMLIDYEKIMRLASAYLSSYACDHIGPPNCCNY